MYSSKYHIVSIENPVEKIKIFRFAPEDKLLGYKPGHFVMLHALDEQGNTIVNRPYSIASSPTEGHLEFCIKIVGGQLTSILDNAKIGDSYGVSNPMGHFVYEDQNKCAFVAGGTGIAPFISMLRYITNKKISGKFVLFYSARNQDLILYKKELESLQKNKDIEIVITLTREEPKDWKGECGRISGEMLKKHIPDLHDYNWYLCGPLKMTISLREFLIKQGTKGDKIKFEGWG